MTTLLRIDASARRTGSLTRQLGDRFEAEWKRERSGDHWNYRDLALQAPSHISEDWIAAAFTPADRRTARQETRLAESDRLIAELVAADIIVLCVPMYNYGMPSALKAWVDNVVRIGRTFSFDLSRGDFPLEPILSGKTLIVLSSSGEFGFDKGGVRGEMDQLVPHLMTLRHYLGIAEHHLIRIEYQEFKDERHAASVTKSTEESAGLARKLTASLSREAAMA
ncbi:FMN-dependent NADH-azoreductase [Roseibium sp.]|uniref:FMN-dependent NADH-azoreductase n=1 Tax=Roseibium sp. TaxID=1936156 RepID=UPI003D0ACB8A